MQSVIRSTTNSAIEGAKVGGVISAATATAGLSISILVMLSNYHPEQQSAEDFLICTGAISMLAPLACAGMAAAANASKSICTTLYNNYNEQQEPLLPVHIGHVKDGRLKQRKGWTLGAE